MADANEDLLDATLRHQVGVRRFSAGEARRALELLEQADRDLVRRLRRALRGLAGRPLNVRSERYLALLRDLRVLRRETMLAYRELVRADLLGLATTEQDFERRVFQAALPVELNFAAASAATLHSVVTSQPFAGGANAARTLQGWFESLERADQRRLTEAINMGLMQQESVDDIVRRVVGTRAAGYRDGVLAATRRNAEAIVRTAINHVSNGAREKFWEANADIIGALRWNATLDGRTSAVCRGRDGHFAPLGPAAGDAYQPRLSPPTARPPAHPNCRSVMVAVLDPEGVANKVGQRPFVRDTRTRRRRERDFRAEAKSRVGPEQWSRLSRAERNALIRQQRSAWAQSAIGQVPPDVNYDTWLRRQPRAFQDEVLGVRKAQLFRKGLRLDQFIDRRGNELTLDQLRATMPELFE